MAFSISAQLFISCAAGGGADDCSYYRHGTAQSAADLAAYAVFGGCGGSGVWVESAAWDQFYVFAISGARNTVGVVRKVSRRVSFGVWIACDGGADSAESSL